MPQLTLIVPAYNEARSIGRTLAEMQAYLGRQGFNYEIIVAADGDDGTRELVRERAAADARLSVLGSPQRGGKGRGIRLAVKQARGDVIGFVDADNKTPITELDKILPWFERGWDVAIGSRAMRDSKIEVPQSKLRQWGSRAFAFVMRRLVGLHGIRDTQCGFKFFRREVAKEIFHRQRIDGYMFDVEILFLAQKAGYSIKEIGVRWRDDGDSRLRLVSGNWRNLKDLLRIRLGKYEPLCLVSAEHAVNQTKVAA